NFEIPRTEQRHCVALTDQLAFARNPQPRRVGLCSLLICGPVKSDANLAASPRLGHRHDDLASLAGCRAGELVDRPMSSKSPIVLCSRSVLPISHRYGAASLSNTTERGASPTGRDEAHRKLISMDRDIPASSTKPANASQRLEL